MEPVSTSLLVKALDGLSLRAQATAENIANAGTANYRPLRVSFEQALASAAPRGVSAINDVEPRIVADDGPEGEAGLRVDLELTTAATTADRYSALIDVLNRQMQLSALVVSGGSTS